MVVKQELETIFNDYFHFLLLIVYLYFHDFQSFFLAKDVVSALRTFHFLPLWMLT